MDPTVLLSLIGLFVALILTLIVNIVERRRYMAFLKAWREDQRKMYAGK